MGFFSSKLEFNSTLCTRIRPNFILLFSPLIYRNALGRAKGAQPAAAKGIPTLLRAFELYGEKQ